MNDQDVIIAFINYIRETSLPGLKIDRWPDKEKENRNSEDIDAIAGDFAIEHTSIDTLPNQRQKSDWFMRAVGNLEQELSNKLSFRLRSTIPLAGGKYFDILRIIFFILIIILRRE